jgi:hypothetical protein
MDKNGEVIYVGMTTSGVYSRLKEHYSSAKKSRKWTHFSIFQVWDNILDDEVVDLEGILRHMYRFNKRAKLQGAKSYNKLTNVTHKTFDAWKTSLG